MNRLLLRIIFRVWGFAIVSFGLVSAAHGHHSHYVDFLPDSNTEVRGTIERVYWSNPHIRWDMIAEDGERWQLHIQPNPALAARVGLTRDTFAVGDELIASGEIGRDGKKWVYVNFMIDDDGDEYGSDEQALSGVSRARGTDLSTADPASWSVDPDYVAPYLGDWRFVLRPQASAPTIFNAAIIEHEGKYVLETHGGVEALHVDADGIRFALHLAAGNGVPFEHRVTGVLNDDGSMSGTWVSNSTEGEFNWIAHRDSGPDDAFEWAATPFVLDGVFGGREVRGQAPFSSYHRAEYALTDAGRARFEELDPLDAQTPRCQPWGPMHNRTYGIDKVEFEWGEDSLIRMRDEWMARDWFADSLPEDLEVLPSRNGFGVMIWEDDHLRIEISHLRPGIMGLMGYPYSANARVVEQIWLSADGNTLRQILTLHDPDYYQFPVVRQIWRASGPGPLYNVDACDADAFYIDLYNRNVFDEYIERTDIRP